MKKSKKKIKENEAYDLKGLGKKDNEKVILGIDPGSRNMGVSAAAYNTETSKIRVIANSVFQFPILELTGNLDQSRSKFIKELQTWINVCRPNGIVAERFQTRGLGGPLIEIVSFMLGVISMVALQNSIPFKAITASTWKNKFNRRHSVDLKEIYGNVLVQPHQLDATLISMYGLEYGLDIEIPYELENLIDKVERTTRVRLINRASRKDAPLVIERNKS